VIYDLDQSPSVDGWNAHFTKRFLGFCSEEYEAMKEWILCLSEFDTYHLTGTSGLGDNLGRAFDTVDLLQKETERMSGKTSSI
jgi:hypothetical protein